MTEQQETMRYYPVQLDLAKRPCLVVGAGSVGTRKVKTLLLANALVTVVDPAPDPAISALAQSGALELIRRPYETRDLDNVFLVIGATENDAVNRRISQDANQRNMLVNIADCPALCNFILPAIVRQKDLVITVSTCGKSPAFAKHLRKGLSKTFGPEYGEFLEIMGAARKKLLAEKHAPEEHKPLFEKLIEGGLLEYIKNQDTEQADHLLNKVLGPEFSVRELLAE